MKTAIVIGATGLVGSNLVKQLLKMSGLGKSLPSHGEKRDFHMINLQMNSILVIKSFWFFISELQLEQLHCLKIPRSKLRRMRSLLRFSLNY